MSNPTQGKSRDIFYLLVVLMHLIAMLGIDPITNPQFSDGICRCTADIYGTFTKFLVGVDFVPFYPRSWCEALGSPLRFIILYRQWYITIMSDPYYNIEVTGHFFDFLVYIELVFQFPLALFIVWSLLSQRFLSGAGELAVVIYGTATGICTAIVCHDMWHLGPDIMEPAAKQTLLYTAYMPYAVIRKFSHLSF